MHSCECLHDAHMYAPLCHASMCHARGLAPEGPPSNRAAAGAVASRHARPGSRTPWLAPGRLMYCHWGCWPWPCSSLEPWMLLHAPPPPHAACAGAQALMAARMDCLAQVCRGDSDALRARQRKAEAASAAAAQVPAQRVTARHGTGLPPLDAVEGPGQEPPHHVTHISTYLCTTVQRPIDACVYAHRSCCAAAAFQQPAAPLVRTCVRAALLPIVPVCHLHVSCDVCGMC